jgi:hypothetical protein
MRIRRVSLQQSHKAQHDRTIDQCGNPHLSLSGLCVCTNANAKSKLSTITQCANMDAFHLLQSSAAPRFCSRIWPMMKQQPVQYRWRVVMVMMLLLGIMAPSPSRHSGGLVRAECYGEVEFTYAVPCSSFYGDCESCVIGNLLHPSCNGWCPTSRKCAGGSDGNRYITCDPGEVAIKDWCPVDPAIDPPFDNQRCISVTWEQYTCTTIVDSAGGCDENYVLNYCALYNQTTTQLCNGQEIWLTKLPHFGGGLDTGTVAKNPAGVKVKFGRITGDRCYKFHHVPITNALVCVAGDKYALRYTLAAAGPPPAPTAPPNTPTPAPILPPVTSPTSVPVVRPTSVPQSAIIKPVPLSKTNAPVGKPPTSAAPQQGPIQPPTAQRPTNALDIVKPTAAPIQPIPVPPPTAASIAARGSSGFRWLWPGLVATISILVELVLAV